MKKKRTKITDQAALLTFAVFAVCVLLVLLYGARVYRDLVQRGEESFAQRTATQYMTMRVRQAERVDISDFEDCQALVLSERIDDTVYVTRVYCYDGYLRELYCAQGAALRPEAGEKVMPADSLQLCMEEKILTAIIDGCTVRVSLRGKTGGAP